MTRRLLATGLSIFVAPGAQAKMDLPFEVEPVTSFDEPWAPAFLPDGRMLVTEKKGNLRAANYGYPIVSNGDHYDGREIPDHDTHPEFEEPAVSWSPVISPADLMIYRGDLFSDWRGDALAAGLSSRAIVRIELDGDGAREVERYDMGARIRSVVEGPDGAIWVLEDDEDDSTGRLLKLTPKD